MSTTRPKKKVIFDCDNTMGLPFKEIDDGLTLLYLLGRPDIELVGVTTTFGNGTAKQSYEQTVALLRNYESLGIPVCLGAGERDCGVTPAAHFLVDTVAACPGEITLLATGPLGNLRAASELDAAFFGNLRQIVCMGGYLHPLRIGRREVAELNLSADPAGARTTLNATCPVTLMNAHICLQAPYRWQDLWRAGYWHRETRRIVRNWLLAFGFRCMVGEFYLWDLLPAVFISHPELFDANPVGIRSTNGDLETGSLVLSDEAGAKQVNMPARILDVDRFRAVLFEAWARSRKSAVDAPAAKSLRGCDGYPV